MGQTLKEIKDILRGILMMLMAMFTFMVLVTTCHGQSEYEQYKKLVERDMPRLYIPAAQTVVVRQKKEWPFNILGIKARITITRKLKFHGNGN